MRNCIAAGINPSLQDSEVWSIKSQLLRELGFAVLSCIFSQHSTYFSRFNILCCLIVFLRVVFDWQLMTPLHYAADRGHREILDLLISSGANVNVVDSDGQTALMVAVLCSNEVCGLIIA